MQITNIAAHLGLTTQVELNEASVANGAPWVIVHVGDQLGGIDLVGTPEELLTLAKAVRDAAHEAEMMRLNAEVAS